MAVEIIVDGYNFIGKHGGLRGDLERSREGLIALLVQYRRRRGAAVTIVFDGQSSDGDFGYGAGRDGVQVIFSRHGETADDVIIRLAQELGNRAVIVSSDREVARAVRAAGGVALAIGEFESRIRASVSDASDEDPPDLPARTTEKRGNPRRRSKADRKKKARLDRL